MKDICNSSGGLGQNTSHSSTVLMWFWGTPLLLVAWSTSLPFTLNHVRWRLYFPCLTCVDKTKKQKTNQLLDSLYVCQQAGFIVLIKDIVKVLFSWASDSVSFSELPPTLLWHTNIRFRDYKLPKDWFFLLVTFPRNFCFNSWVCLFSAFYCFSFELSQLAVLPHVGLHQSLCLTLHSSLLQWSGWSGRSLLLHPYLFLRWEWLLSI